jgi:hypothetical protein
VLGYPHRLTITAPRTGGSASQSVVTGLLTPQQPADEVIVYAGEGEMQDGGARESRPEDGGRQIVADGVGFLKDESQTFKLAPRQMVVRLDAYGRERIAEIVSVRELDGSFLYRWRETTAQVERRAVG